MPKIEENPPLGNPQTPHSPPDTTADRFALLAWGAARLWQLTDKPLSPYADRLHAWAVREKLTEQIGEDGVQSIIAAAFSEVRDDL
jgi:hypothetical protein